MKRAGAYIVLFFYFVVFAAGGCNAVKTAFDPNPEKPPAETRPRENNMVEDAGETVSLFWPMIGGAITTLGAAGKAVHERFSRKKEEEKKRELEDWGIEAAKFIKSMYETWDHQDLNGVIESRRIDKDKLKRLEHYFERLNRGKQS